MRRFNAFRMLVAAMMLCVMATIGACAANTANDPLSASSESAAQAEQGIEQREQPVQTPQQTPDSQPVPDSPSTLEAHPGSLDAEDTVESVELSAGTLLEATPEETLPMKKRQLPEGFVYLDEAIPSARFDIRYYGEYNFVGTQIDGYVAPYAIGSVPMAEALRAVSEELTALGYRLLIYDAYRPQKAVQHFIRWSNDSDDTAMKNDFYPNENKRNLFQHGYLARKSGHSRGSTIDLTLIDADTGEMVDMGSPYDMLDEISHFDSINITEAQASNRKLLKTAMERHGFQAYRKEWWHFTLKREPYPHTYFDFDVE